MIITTQWFGTFLVERESLDNDTYRIIEKILFQKNPDHIAEILMKLNSNEILDEERDLLVLIDDSRGSEIEADDARLREISQNVTDRIELDPDTYGYDIALLQEASIIVSKASLKGQVKKDKHIIQGINLIDELTKQKNILSERLVEWYNIYFPEAVLEADQERLVEGLMMNVQREKISIFLDMEHLFQQHTGSEIGKSEFDRYQQLIDTIKNLDNNISDTKKYIELTVLEIAPNLTRLCGPMISARLISSAGSLKRMSQMPASTIQMLGAEKALFRFLKKKGTPPKHGIIFMHPSIRNAPYWQRGKIARCFAAKLSIAVRVDNYSDKNIGEEIQLDLEKKLEDIRKNFPNPPAKKKTIKKTSKKMRNKNRRGKRSSRK